MASSRGRSARPPRVAQAIAAAVAYIVSAYPGRAALERNALDGIAKLSRDRFDRVMCRRGSQALSEQDPDVMLVEGSLGRTPLHLSRGFENLYLVVKFDRLQHELAEDALRPRVDNDSWSVMYAYLGRG